MKLFRNDPELDDAARRELDAVDSALAGVKVDAELADLAQLATELRQDRPVPRELFVAELDRRVADGFPPARRPGAEQTTEAGGWKRPSWLTWRQLAPVTAVAASLALVGGAVLSSGVVSKDNGGTPAGGRGDGSPVATAIDRSEGKQQVKREQAPSVAAGTPPTEDGAAAKPGTGSDALRQREVVRNAQLTLATPPGKLEDVADDVIRVTDRYQGFVATSEVSGGDAARGSFELRIPSQNVQAALADLSELGHVRERTQSTDDITSSFVSNRARINRLSKERRGLLRQLAAAATPAQAAAAKARLRGVDARLALARNEAKRLRNQVSFSNVTVELQADAKAASGDGKFTPSDALHDARDILGAGLGVLLIAAALLLPAALLLTVGLLALRWTRRRGREQALDSADDR